MGGTCELIKQGTFFLKKDLLYRRLAEDPIATSQLVVPTPYRKQMLETGHSANLSGYIGMTGTKACIQHHY